MPLDRSNLETKLRGADVVEVQGRVQAVVGLGIHGVIPGARLGELVKIERGKGQPLLAEVVGFRSETVVLAPLGSTQGVGPDDIIRMISSG